MKRSARSLLAQPSKALTIYIAIASTIPPE